jgi:HK97 family phage major capsid protein
MSQKPSLTPNSLPKIETSTAFLHQSRTLASAPLSRSLEIDSTTIDKERRTVEAAISSEFPVQREFGVEVLDHSPESINLTRMKRAPLLDNHDRGLQIGVVEACWLGPDRRLRARVRFSRNPAAELIWQDVLDEIRVNVSLSYLAHLMVPEYGPNGEERYRIISWEPYEVSSVSVPADPTVGVGRSLPEKTLITIKGKSMDPVIDETGADLNDGTKDQQRSLPAEPRDPLGPERKRVADIMALGNTHNQRALAEQAVNAGYTVAQTQSMILARMAPQPLSQHGADDQARDLPNFKTPGQDMGKLGVKPEEMQTYSLMRAINAMATGNWKEAGFERSISLAIADASKKDARGLFVPHESLFQRQLEKKTPGKGGVLVETDLRLDQFTDTLRNKAMIGRLGARVLSGLQGDLAIPRKTSGTNFYWLDEDNEPEDSDFDFSTLGLSPKTIAGAIGVTRRLRKQSSLSVENLMRQDMIEGIAVAIDYAQLRGTGLNNMPLGLLNQPGLQGATYDDRAEWDHIVDMETAIAEANADESGMAYLTSPTQRGKAKKTQVFANTGERLWQDNTVNGYRSFATNQMPSDAWLFGDWSQIITAMWGVLDINIDTAKKAGSDGVIMRIFQDVDTAARRLESFSCLRKKIASGG